MCILFVENDFIIAVAAEDALRGAGHRVMTAAHTSEAVNLINDHPDYFTCLVTDLNMPGEMSGLDLVEHARQRYPAIPVVVATSRPDAAISKWRERHQVKLLTKPYRPEFLVQTVEKLLEEADRIVRPELWTERLIQLEGEIARGADLPRWRNPYTFGGRQYFAWAQGWDTGDD